MGLFILYLPFEVLGQLLRSLSLSGSLGNAVAWGLYVVFSLLPLGWGALWLNRKKEPWRAIELLLVLVSIYSFYLFYQFINPQLFYQGIAAVGEAADLEPMLKGFAAMLWYVFLGSYILLRLTRQMKQEAVSERKGYLYGSLSKLLFFSVMFYGASALYGAGIQMVEGVQALGENAGARGFDYLFIGLRFLLMLLPKGCLLGTLWQGRNLLKKMEEGPYGAKTVEAARKLAIMAVGAVKACVYSALLWNGSLFLFRTELVSVDYSLHLSLQPLLLAFAALILARYVEEAGELYQEHEMII
ncbi:MAG: hypothetical protein HFI33_11770 [Lachnospiraceae bacterium]|nr:hypothetical protein [Lachnospiraceae bacterium]